MLRILKCATSNDILTIKAVDNPNVVEFTFDTPDKDVQAQYEMKLINLDQEHLGIPVIIVSHHCYYYSLKLVCFFFIHHQYKYKYFIQ